MVGAIAVPGASNTPECLERWSRSQAVRRARLITLEPNRDRLSYTTPRGTTVDETSLLAVFEAHHDRVLRAAARVYARGRKRSYEIGANDV